MIKLLLVLSLSFSMLSFAGKKTHNFAAQFGIGSLKGGGIESDYGSIGAEQKEVSYQYRVADEWLVGLSVINGDARDAFCFITCFSLDTKFTYRAPSIITTKEFPVSARSDFFFKFGASDYSWRYRNEDDSALLKDSGLGFQYGLGWKFESNLGLGFAFEYKQLKIGDFKVITHGAQIQMSF